MAKKQSPKTTFTVRVLPKYKRLLVREARKLQTTPSAYVEGLIKVHLEAIGMLDGFSGATIRELGKQ